MRKTVAVLSQMQWAGLENRMLPKKKSIFFIKRPVEMLLKTPKDDRSGTLDGKQAPACGNVIMKNIIKHDLVLIF